MASDARAGFRRQPLAEHVAGGQPEQHAGAGRKIRLRRPGRQRPSSAERAQHEEALAGLQPLLAGVAGQVAEHVPPGADGVGGIQRHDHQQRAGQGAPVPAAPEGGEHGRGQQLAQDREAQHGPGQAAARGGGGHHGQRHEAQAGRVDMAVAGIFPDRQRVPGIDQHARRRLPGPAQQPGDARRWPPPRTRPWRASPSAARTIPARWRRRSAAPSAGRWSAPPPSGWCWCRSRRRAGTRARARRAGTGTG